ncbi:MAG TPA: hypothetical protein VHI52_06310 [Verrucomicrobiae bacterium]|nr:hypothetical protein [Verrucomicrobiae bacterium]
MRVPRTSVIARLHGYSSQRFWAWRLLRSSFCLRGSIRRRQYGLACLLLGLIAGLFLVVYKVCVRPAFHCNDYTTSTWLVLIRPWVARVDRLLAH